MTAKLKSRGYGISLRPQITKNRIPSSRGSHVRVWGLIGVRGVLEGY
jgi:hypothetical protein